MTEAVLVGVDCGGTRTNVEIVVGSPEGLEVRYEIDESLSGSLEPERYSACLRSILAPLEFHIADIPQISDAAIYVFISAAGFSSWVRDDFIRAIDDVCRQLAGGKIVAVGAANDAISLLVGLRADGVIVAGTGSNMIVRTADGHLYQVGGHEWVACDYGSGFWIGLRSVREAYRHFEAGVDSVLLQRLRQLYGIRSSDETQLIARLRDLGIADSNMKREIARFAASVCAAAERGDLDAQNIVKAEAEDLADVTAGALRRRYSSAQLSGGITLVQCGSVLANTFYRASFEAQLEMRLRTGFDQSANIHWKRVTTALEAAVNLARDLTDSNDEMLQLDLVFRPVVVWF